MTLEEIRMQIKSVRDELARLDPPNTPDDVLKTILLSQDLQMWVTRLVAASGVPLDGPGRSL